MSNFTEVDITKLDALIDRVTAKLRILRELKRKNTDVEAERLRMNQENGSEKMGGPYT